MTGSAALNGRLGWGGLAIVVFALTMRLYYISVAQVDQPLRADAGQYFRIALNVKTYGTFSTAAPNSDGVVADTYRAPGYPALIALFASTLNNTQKTYWAILLLQCLLGAATVSLSILLALRLMPRPWAYAAGIIVAIWPHLITLGGYVLTETVFGFLVALSAYTLVLMLEGHRWLLTVCAAACLAMAALVNQVILGFSIPLVAWFCFSRRSLRACLFALLAIGPPTLWAIRDIQLNSLGMRSGSGRLIENILIGAEPDFIPRYKDNANDSAAVAARERISAEQRVFAADPRRAAEDVLNRLSSEPKRYLLWYLSKPAAFWAWSIVQGYGDVYEYTMLVAPFDVNPGLRLIASICHGLNNIVMIAALAGVILYFRRRREESTCYQLAGAMVMILFVYATVVHSILTPDARYAVPFRPFEIILALLAAYTLIEIAFRRGRRSLRA